MPTVGFSRAVELRTIYLRSIGLIEEQTFTKLSFITYTWKQQVFHGETTKYLNRFVHYNQTKINMLYNFYNSFLINIS